MMSLVAYGSSGESENESDNEGDTVAREMSLVTSSARETVNDSSPVEVSLNSKDHSPLQKAPCVPIAKSDLHSKLPPPKAGTSEIIEDDDDDESSPVCSKLPAPKHHTAPSLLQNSVVLPKDSKIKGKKGIVKILIPSLSDFPDEDEPKAKKKIQPSAKGSGLFALLPPPKQATVKEANRTLVPNVLTRKPAPIPPIKKTLPRSANQSLKRKQPDSDPESDGENDALDFFSLNKEDKLPDIPAVAIESIATTSSEYQDPTVSYQQNSSCADYQYQQYEQHAEESSLPQADSGQDFIQFEGSGDLQLDDEALAKLCGRRGRKREEIQIVDVSGDSIMPDQREWLTKQLTEEQPRSSGKSKIFSNSMQKRKHQITYLAHIAKENEIELKNQWANNRQSRKQTQSKYGF